MPPQKRDVPRTRRRLERMEPKREYLTRAILWSLRANIAIMSSVAFPHVAFRSPPTAKSHNKLLNNLKFWNCKLLILTFFFFYFLYNFLFLLLNIDVQVSFSIPLLINEGIRHWIQWWYFVVIVNLIFNYLLDKTKPFL